MHYDWSDEVKEMEKKLEPYFADMGGLKLDAPPEMQALYERYHEKCEEEAWLL